MENLVVGNPCPDSVSGVSAHLFLTLVNALTHAKCQISSPQYYPEDYAPNLQDQDEFDFIVVGGGSGGSVVANKLSENPNWKVLVLEAGKLPSPNTEIPSLLFSLQKTEEDWQYATEATGTSCLGLKEKKCAWPRGKVLGGTSCINANLYIRGNKRDYDRWSELGNKNWDYDSVLRHFKENEDLQVEELAESKTYGRGGYLPLSVYHSDEPIKAAFEESGRLLGYPTVLEEQNLGYFDATQTTEKGVRANAAKSFLGKVRERPNLKVALNSFVEKLRLKGKKVEGVEVTINNKKIFLRARKEVVVSAGSINTPQLLMLSGIGPEDHLKELGIPVVQNLPVGENLQDHAIYAGLYVAIKDTTGVKDNVLDELYQYFMYRKGKVSQIGITNFVGFINTRNDSPYPNLQFHHIYFEQNDNYLLHEIIKVMGISDEIAAKEVEFNKKSPTIKVVPTLLNPKSIGKILLRSKDPLDKPLIHANYLEDPQDVEILLEGIKFVTKQLKTVPFEKYQPKIIDLKLPGCESLEFESDDYWRCALRRLTTTLYHPAGTCKMGAKSDPTAVVDDRLRVYGIDNLRVADASIMPLITSGNTNAPTLMIGRKAGSMIEEDWTDSHNEL